MDKVINLGIPHVGELIFNSFDTPGLINCMEVSETWKALALNVLIKRPKGKVYMEIFKAYKSRKFKIAQCLLAILDDDELFQCELVSKTWKVLAENVLIKRWKGKMFEACKSGETQIVKLLLERCNSEESGLNSKDEYGATALMWACFNGHKDVVKLLLDSNIELNARSDYGDTALMWACQNGHKDVVQLLLDYSDSNMDDFLDWGYIIDVNATNNYGWTAFMAACCNGHNDVVQLLLNLSDRNIDMNARNNQGYTAFMYACYNGHKDVVQLLLDHSERIDFNAKDTSGNTAFMWACDIGHTDIVKSILNHVEWSRMNLTNTKIELNTINNDGFTPFMTACLKKRKRVIDLLAEYRNIVLESKKNISFGQRD